ncbi:glyoxalase/bleomycin resistance protein/dioxygenase superfamily protein [Knoellia remsis]|uniref:Glyoxalase/bleomycin resistance protein/dioxygenase superfamily protein n=1 Tax=Knoellia remsis TaxID=407159 RepID=A0A2T0TZ31_9MICO|nr:VOC family protein [Knoellia remsis]PRY50931.1 glyoxalase/bleomycin resistance protein/dioxygenase superfamily protein [Knoellia remsis]
MSAETGAGRTTGPTPSGQRIRQLRVVVEAADYDEAVRFYRDVLGMDEIGAFSEGAEDRVAILEAGRATLEIASPAHREAIDRVEAGGTPSPRIRLAFEVDDSQAATRQAADAGANIVAEPVLTPWMSLNSRLEAPAELTITLFEETEDSHERAEREGFGTNRA